MPDIAHALSMQCRFNGHSQFYSVAEHSMVVASLVPHQFRLEALLHDAAEAYLGDIVSPLKALLPDYQALETKVDQAIRAKYCLPSEHTPEVTAADKQALILEFRHVFPGAHLPGGVAPTVYQRPEGLAPSVAESMFLEAIWRET